MPHATWSATGTFNRNAAWGIFVFMSTLAFYFNSCLLIAIIRLKDRKTSTDVLIGGLASGILVGCIACGPQCLFNLIFRDFAGGDPTCFMQAFFHLVSMEIQFLCVCAIAYRTYIGVVKLEQFSLTKAFVCVVVTWCLALSGTALFGNFSPIFMVTSGFACFYEWTSIVLLAWAWPMAVIAACLMGFWYYQTFRTVQAVRRSAKEIRIDGSARNADLVLKLSFLVVFFVFGYSGIVGQSLYESFTGKRAREWQDMTAATMLLIYWVVCPFAYAYCNHRLGLSSTLYAFPVDLQSAQSSKERPDSRIKTEISPPDNTCQTPGTHGFSSRERFTFRAVRSVGSSPEESAVKLTEVEISPPRASEAPQSQTQSTTSTTISHHSSIASSNSDDHLASSKQHLLLINRSEGETVEDRLPNVETSDDNNGMEMLPPPTCSHHIDDPQASPSIAPSSLSPNNTQRTRGFTFSQQPSPSIAQPSLSPNNSQRARGFTFSQGLYVVSEQQSPSHQHSIFNPFLPSSAVPPPDSNST